MSKSKYDENKCLNSLARNHKVKVATNYDGHGIMLKCLEIPKENNIGIHSWGMIDFLVNYCGYHYRFYDNTKQVSVATKKNKHKKSNKYQEYEEA